jgi:EAL domain-containing protein (putative c-di-GMP-specific phosphodiesterase class I)
MCRNTNDIKLTNVVQNIRSKLVDTHLVENLIINVNLDIGAVIMDTINIEPPLWLEYAEIAMLESKSLKDTDIVWYHEEMYAKNEYKKRLEVDLQHAISNDELFLVYQPQINQLFEVIGAEALLRWNHHEFGIISPTIFIPLAEKLGLIDAIGQFVIDETLRTIGLLRERNIMPIPLSVNASFIELINPQYVHRIKSKMEMANASAKDLHIEITETAIAQHMENVINTIDELFEINVKLLLDDFGTGYSSLSHLSHFPISIIKIDKLFIDSFLENEKIHQILESLVLLAHKINMKVIAEGVETKAQFQGLIEMDCDYYQGYYYSKPIELDAFMSLLINESKS